MKKLTKEKQQHLILVCLLTAIALAGLGYGVIRPQYQNRGVLKQKKEEAQQRLQQVMQTIENADQIESGLCEAKKQLDKIEDGLPTGDLYSWSINMLRTFKLAYKVAIPQYSQVDGPKDTTILAAFPYKQATMTIGGNAAYNEFGRFIADFENQFPYFRVMNLNMEPAQGNGADGEKVAFKVEVAMLVKPSTS